MRGESESIERGARGGGRGKNGGAGKEGKRKVSLK